jgi:Flp pilus assembly protein TadG
VEFAVLAFPILMLTFIVTQAAFVFYARSTALAAATQGANAARAYNATPNAGVTKANDFLNVVGGGLRDPSVSVSSTGTEVTITVTGQARTVIPGLSFTVSQSASGPVERFVP